MMRHEHTLSIRQGAQLALTPKLQQAIALLQLSTPELNEFVRDKLNENPLLTSPDDDTSAPITQNDDQDDNDYGAHSYTTTSSKNHSSNQDEHKHDIPLWKSTMTFHEHISSQIRLKLPKQHDQDVAFALLEHLNEDGFLDDDWQLFLDFSVLPKSTSWDKVMEILSILQTCEPVGIFARTVIESLSIQLKHAAQHDDCHYHPDQIETMMAAFTAIKSDSFENVCKRFNLKTHEFQTFLQHLKHLQFRPAQAFNTEESVMTIIPDVKAYKTQDNDIAIAINPHAIPKVLANSAYYNEIKQKVKRANDVDYLKEQWMSANWLVQALQKRTVTLMQVSSEIAQWQKEFLLHSGELRPMTLKDIATKTGVHESTVSRITTSKFIDTARGVFELKAFFVNTASGTSENAASSVEIQNVLRSLVADEHKHNPLSDEDLVALLDTKGFQVARRTIAKYRTLLGIATSAQRKRHYKMQNMTVSNTAHAICRKSDIA